MPHPNKRVPWLMVGSIGLGFLSVFPLMLVLMFAMTDMDAVTSASLPSLEMFVQVTGSKVAATFMQAWILSIYISMFRTNVCEGVTNVEPHSQSLRAVGDGGSSYMGIRPRRAYKTRSLRVYLG